MNYVGTGTVFDKIETPSNENIEYHTLMSTIIDCIFYFPLVNSRSFLILFLPPFLPLEFASLP
jgi:hypothetical protein